MNAPTEKSLAHITAEAAEWFTTLRGEALTPAERERFADWLDESPVHVREYLGVAEAWAVLSAADADADAWPTASAEELIAATRATANVVTLPASEPADGAARQQRKNGEFASARRERRLWLSAIAATLLVTAVTFIAGRDIWRGDEQYFTQRGEQRSIVLSDGSVVRLNTLSRVTVHIDERQRRIELTEGEAFFRVQHDPTRSFIVATPLATVRAVGTQFNVSSRERATEVAVVEGKVVVSGAVRAEHSGRTPSIPMLPVDLAAGQQVVVTADLIDPPKPVDVTAAMAWTQRRLAFDNERVDRVVEEFNRYNNHRLEVLDPQLAALRVSGVFDADDPGALVQYLEQVQGVHVEIDHDVSRLTQRDE